MSIIKQAVFDKYGEFVDHMTDDFGISCLLVYAHKVNAVTPTAPLVKQRKSMDVRQSAASDFARGSDDFKTVETTEAITLRIYSNKKDFAKFGNVNIPDEGIMAYGKRDLLYKVEMATYLIINDGSEPTNTLKYEKIAAPAIHGLNANYFISYWKRV